MITILPSETCGENAFVLCEDGCESSKCFYTAAPGKGEITEISFKAESDFYIADAVVRAVLNSLDMRGVTTVTCKNKKLFPLLEKIGFHTDESGETVSVNTEKFFSGLCECHRQTSNDVK